LAVEVDGGGQPGLDLKGLFFLIEAPIPCQSCGTSVLFEQRELLVIEA
jgi:hypothetical protein